MSAATAHVAFHDAECGGYADDLPAWIDLADRSAGPILDLGCGTGRVALRLAERGHEVWALDTDRDLVAELTSRADRRAVAIRARCGDCRRLELGREFDLVIAPMQLVQLLGGPTGRRELLEGVGRHLSPAGVFAAAIVEGVPPGVIADGAKGLPDVHEQRGYVYSSRPVGAGIAEGALEVRRLRQTVAPDGEMTEQLHADRLDLLDAASLEAEAQACGLRPLGRVDIPAGESHVGSTVVLVGGDA